MGILDQVTGAIAGAKGAGANAVLLQQLIAMLSKPGALDGLMASFTKNGLSDVLQSWVGTGKNLPISAAQIQTVLGNGVLSDLAGKAGLQAPQAASAIADLLPKVVDKLSPAGKLPATKDLGGLLAGVGKLLG